MANLALPDLQKTYAIDISVVQWVVEAYALTLASLLLPTVSIHRLEALHDPRSAVIKALLLLRGTKRMMVINVPWYLEKSEQEDLAASSESELAASPQRAAVFESGD